MKRNWIWIAFWVASLLWVGLDAQVTVQLRPVQDNTLYEDASGALSNGVGSHIFVGKTNNGLIRRALLRFEVIEFVPPNATIQQVELTLNLSRTIVGPTDVSLHRLLNPWGEGNSDAPGEEGQGAPSQPGDATWIHTFFDTSFWAQPGGDFLPMASATASVGSVVNPLNPVTWGSTAQMVADVQFWLAHPDSNFGWILIGDETTQPSAKRFDSKDHPDTLAHPILTITYTMPTGVEEPLTSGVKDFQLLQNYPNPFNPSTTIEFRLSHRTRVRLRILNLLGQEIRRLVDGELPAGTHQVQWDGRSERGTPMPAGIYLYELSTETSRQVRKMVLLP